MGRLAPIVVAACIIAASAAVCGPAADTGDVYRDKDNGFELFRPSGWRIDVPPRPAAATPREKIVLRLRAPDSAVTHEACVVVVTETPETAKASQADIDHAVRDKRFASSELAVLQQKDPAARIASLHISSDNGLTEADSEAVFHLADAAGRNVVATIRSFEIVTPSRTYALTCSANPENYPAKRADFDRLTRSFKLTSKPAR